MSRKVNVSHNACYDYSKRRWNIQPSDMVRFWDRDSSFVGVGEVISLTVDLIYIRRLKDNRIFVISLYDIRDWQVLPVDFVRRLPAGIFSVGECVNLDGDLNLPFEENKIVKFERNLVKIRHAVKGHFVGFFYVREGEVLKILEVK